MSTPTLSPPAGDTLVSTLIGPDVADPPPNRTLAPAHGTLGPPSSTLAATVVESLAEAHISPLQTGASGITFTDDPHRPAPPRPPAVTLGFGQSVLPAVDRAHRNIAAPEVAEVRFRPIGKLGEGGLGEVVAAFDEDIGRKVAVKRIRADRVSASTLARFVQEIRTVGALEHANIVPIHDVGRDQEGALYFVMRYVDGETLETVIQKLREGDRAYHARYSFERRLRVVAEVLEALAFAHAQGVIHRDVKPANVMIGRYGEVMLLDWGISRLVGTPDTEAPSGPLSGAPAPLAQTRAGSLVGTPAYMSPEQARGEPADARSDLFAVSVMLHEFLTLQHYLHDCTTLEAILIGVQERKVPLAGFTRSPHQPAVPMDLSWFVHDGLHRDPARRYPSAQSMLDRIARRAEGDIPIQCHVTATRQITNKLLRFFDRNVLVVSVLILLGVMGVGGWFAALLFGMGVFGGFAPVGMG